MKSLSVKTRLGFNLSQQVFRGYNPITPENSEPGRANSIDETTQQTTDWTWTNTLNYSRTFGRHNLGVLVGQEANEITGRFLFGTSVTSWIPTRAADTSKMRSPTRPPRTTAVRATIRDCFRSSARRTTTTTGSTS